MNEYELIYLAQEHDEEAEEQLYKKYKGLLEKNAKKFLSLNKNSGITLEDIMLEIKIWFNVSINSFNPDKGASFGTYLLTIINNKFKVYNRNVNKKGDTALNNSISLDDDSSINYLNMLYNEEDNVEYMIFDKEVEYGNNNIKYTKREKEVIYLLKENYTYDDIALILGKDKKYVYNVVCRIKNKLK